MSRRCVTLEGRAVVRLAHDLFRFLRSPVRLRCPQHQQQHVVVVQDLLSSFRARVRSDRLARGGVQRDDGLPVAQRHVDAISDRHQPPGDIRRPATEISQVIFPRSDFARPQADAVERVLGHQSPTRAGSGEGDRAFVDDGKQPSFGRDHRGDTGQVIVTARKSRSADPLKVPRRTDDRVLRDRVVVGAVQVMRPLVDVIRPWLRENRARLGASGF